MLGKSAYISKIAAEVERGLKTYARYGAWLASDVIQWPFWTVFFFLSIMMYSPDLLSSKPLINILTWSFFAFVFVSSFLWAASSVVMEVQQGIIEQLILAKTSLRLHLVGRTVITVLDILVGGVILLLLSSLIFGAELTITHPTLFIASTAIAFVFFLSFTSVLTALLIAVRSPWVVVSILQFIIPFSSGGIPVQLLPPEAARIVLLSPFFYVIHPIVASASNSFYIPAENLIAASAGLTVVMFFASIYIERKLINRTLKKGKFTVF
ncbi:MAG: hypothetical protein QXV27_04485 [Candidatus Caldarchaeum sp.]